MGDAFWNKFLGKALGPAPKPAAAPKRQRKANAGTRTSLGKKSVDSWEEAGRAKSAEAQAKELNEDESHAAGTQHEEAQAKEEKADDTQAEELEPGEPTGGKAAAAGAEGVNMPTLVVDDDEDEAQAAEEAECSPDDGKVAAPFVRSNRVPINMPPAVCCKCGIEVDPLRCAGKSQGTWKCRSCNSKLVQLVKHFGSWPLPEYRSLTDKAKLKFWNDAKNCQSTAAVAELVRSSITMTATNHEATSMEGSWLPLSVWKRKGWNTKEILDTATAANSKPHPRWGMVYQVEVETDSRGSRREQTQSESASSSFNPRPPESSLPKEPQREPAPKRKAPSPATDTESEDQESSSDSGSKRSSSTTSEPKGKKKKKASSKHDRKEKRSKKQKKSKKVKKTAQDERKRQEREKKAAQAQEHKEKANILRAANRAMAKLSPIQLSLNSTLASEGITKHSPPFALTKGKEAAKEIDKMMKAATAVVQRHKSDFPYDMDAVAAAATEGSQSQRLLSGFLLTASKHV